MKFLFLSSFAHLVLDPASTRVSGGAELQVALLARELAARGYETVIASGDIGQADRVTHQGVLIRTAGKFHTGALSESLTALPRVIQVLAQEKPTHVLVLGWTAWLFILLLLRPFFGFKLVFICGLDTEVNGEFRRENPIRGALFEYGLRHCDIRFARTSRCLCRVIERMGIATLMSRNLQRDRAGPSLYAIR